tara:strand:+ start:27900 stop:28208 length:309 start_codon:yes stop_codon:yes gene_type:complete
MNQLKAGIKGTIAANECTVHADLFAGEAKADHLIGCNFPKHLSKQIAIMLTLVGFHITAKLVIGGFGRYRVAQIHASQRLTVEQVEAAGFKQLLIAQPYAVF